jgi:hypothetical protein
MSTREGLARQQEALAAALVAGAAAPPGFDVRLLDAARNALLNKRAGEVSHAWPELAAALGPQWRVRFKDWARARAPRGSLRDGFDFARDLAAAGDLPERAAVELAAREGHWHYDGTNPPRPRRIPPLLRHWIGRHRVWRLTGAR